MPDARNPTYLARVSRNALKVPRRYDSWVAFAQECAVKVPYRTARKVEVFNLLDHPNPSMPNPYGGTFMNYDAIEYRVPPEICL